MFFSGLGNVPIMQIEVGNFLRDSKRFSRPHYLSTAHLSATPDHVEKTLVDLHHALRYR